jgi:tetratricopeptide (TPR) repeat protein
LAVGPESIDHIFWCAAQLASAPERGAYLDRACGGDAELRRRVEQLLQARSEAESFLESPALGAGGGDGEHPLREGPGTVIGPYRLLEQVGEGGFAVVFMAEQTQPVRRKVALKVLKPGMDSKQVVARFEQERQALALMDHPHIAKILDAGEAASGRPYFVMELVKGVPITQFCDERRLTTRERLGLFVDVCQAVQHAHQKGVIHRDIKPSNVLVTLHDGKPVVKVIDFGIAKAIGQQLTDKAFFTGFAQVVGTPLYMSPEQAALSGLDVDTRSDVYSLGVLLYELLTGTTPLEEGRVRSVTWDELLRIIREEEPPRPSTRVSTLGPAAATVATHRQSDPWRLTRLFRGELDWVVMKALEKDRDRRYETVSAFAADVQRYLADEPVQACPPSAWYRCRKFARRNRPVLATAGFVLFFLVFLGAIVGWAVRDRGVRQALLGQEVAGALKEAETASERGKWSEALAAVKRAGGLLAGGGGSDELQERVRQWGADLDLVARLQDARMLGLQVNVAESRFRQELALPEYEAAFRDHGLGPHAVTAEEAALRVRSKPPQIQLAIVAALDDWIDLMLKLRSQDGHQPAWPRAVVRAVDTDPWRLDMRAAAEERDFTRLVDLAASPDVIKQGPGTLERLGALLCANGKREQGLRLLRLAQQIYPGDFWINTRLRRELPHATPPQHADAVRFASIAVALQPENAGARVNLGFTLENAGQLEEAITAYRHALALKPDYAAARADLARSLAKQGKLDEAIAEYREAVRIKPDYVDALNNLGGALADKGRLDEAIAEYREALRISPDMALAHYNLGNALRDKGRWDEAIAEFREAVRIKPDYVDAHNNLGRALTVKGRLKESIAEFRQAIALDPKYAPAHVNLGSVLLDQGRLDDAIGHYEQALRLDPKLVQVHGGLGLAFLGQGRWAEARDAARRCLGLTPQPGPLRTAASKILQRSEHMLALEGRLPAVLQGKDRPAGAGEWVELAKLCQTTKRYAAAARLYADAFAAGPKLADDLRAGHRYNAACCAALAAGGQGTDAPKPDAKGRALLRRQALDWLRTDLALCAKGLERGTAQYRATALRALQRWQQDPALEGVRGATALAKLPEAEQESWRALWVEATELLKTQDEEARGPGPREPDAKK